MKHIALLFGGNGSESAVSFSSSRSVLASLKSIGFTVTELEFDKNFIENVQRIKPDIVFNAMHGKYGEDGTVPTILDFLQVPYTHSGRKASIIGMNKEFTKQIAKSLNISVMEGKLYTKDQLLRG
jgi:D-alanine-D-alanine ligase